MADPRASQFWRFAVKSGLLDDGQLQACWEKVPEDKRTADAIDRRLARRAVDAGLITVWQAQQLLTGRATGFKIDRYLLLDLIGQGGMGRVYLAKDTRLGRRVAIKVLSKERMNNPRALTRFQREAKVGAQLQHENLVRIYDQGESSGIHYLVMEHLDGRNVAQLIGERGSIAWPEAARLARQIALGLEHAQQKGLIHRDVNPANILVTRDGTAKLADLGLAIDLADEANVTRDGATVGTFDYISPEQAKHSRDVDTRADIYSLGCTLYHMISGRVPFPMPSLAEKLYAHQLHDPDPLTAPSGDLPEGLAEVVRRMMRKRPEERYPTPLATAQELEPFAEPVGSGSSSGLRRSPAGVAPQPAGPAAAAAAAAAPTVVAEAPVVTESGPLGVSGSDPDLVLFALDTGPEVSLTESLTAPTRPRPKPRAKPQEKPKPEPEPKPVVEPRAEAPPRPAAARRRRPLSPRARASAMAAVGVLVVAASVTAIVAMVAMSRKKLQDPPDEAEPDPSVVAAREKSRGQAGPPGPISVALGGRMQPARSLAEAVSIAAGNGGEVVLAGPGTIRLASSEEVHLPRGRVAIRAAEGMAPVVAIDVAAGKSLLVTTPGTSLTLRGLRLVAHYQSADPPTPLIEAGGSVTLERCVIVAAGARGESRCVRAEGPRLVVDGCLIAGFGRALDITSFPGSAASVKQSILVHAGGSDRSPGWLIRVAFGGGQGAEPRKLTLDHVTARGGLIEVVDFPVASPLIVGLDRVAVQAPSLVAWTPRLGESDEGWAKGLTWTGKANLFDVTGAAWVVASADGGPPTPNAPRDLAGWTAAVGSDKDSAARSFRFAANPAEIAFDLAGVEPGLFALEGEGTEGVGADPKGVGPVGGRAPKEIEPAKREESAKKAEPAKRDEPEKSE